MSSRNLERRLAAAFASCVVALVTAAPAPAAPAASRRKALLIGINEYVAVPDLRGALNDVDMMEELLVTRFGFREQDIEVIRDEAGTREGILAALDRLAQRVEPGDFVYVHYSGHGSQAPDASGDESDGFDETLVPQDGRTSGVPDITDDELASALSKLDARQVFIVLDSCHSGTATRGVVQPRAVPTDLRADLYPATSTRAVVPLVQANHVLMTGAADNQEALDGPVDGRLHGLFSYALARSMANSAPGTSPRMILVGVGAELERIKAQLGLRSMPEPQLEAPADRLEAALFEPPAAEPEPTPADAGQGEPAPQSARLPWVTLEKLGDGRVRLLQGQRLGAAVGSIWGVYPAGELRFAPGEALAQAEVSAVEGADATAKLDPADAALPDGARAILLAPPPSEDRVPVRLSDADGERAARLQAALRERLDAVVFVPDGEFARFAVQVGDDGCQVFGADGSFEIASFTAGDEDALAGELAALFARSMTAAELLALDNPATTLQLELATAGNGGASESTSDDGVIVSAGTSAPVYRIRKAGEPRSATNSLQLRIQPSAACYLSVVDVDSEGRIYLLFPNALSEAKGYLPDGRLEAGEPVLIPDSLESGNQAGFHIDYSPPVGTDTVRAFCAVDRSVAVAMRDAIGALESDASPASRGVRDEVRRSLDELRTLLARTSARGLKLVPDVPEQVAQVEQPEPEPTPVPEPEPAPTPEPEPAPAKPPAPPPDWVAASLSLEVAE